MPVRFLLGPAGSGKTTYCLEELRKLERAGIPGCYLVPEQFTYSADRHILDTPELSGLRHVRVLSFSRLAQGVRERAGEAGLPHVDDATRPMLLRVVLDRLSPEELGPLVGLRHHVGVLRHLARFIGEVRNHGPTDFLTAVRRAGSDGGEGDAPRRGSMAGIPTGVFRKIESLTGVFEAYDALLRDLQLEDPEQLLIGLNQGIWAERTRWVGVPVFVDGFLSWTRREREVLVALAMAGARVEIALCCDAPTEDEDSRSPFRPVHRSLQTMERALSDARVAIDPPRVFATGTPRFREAPGVETLERELYGEVGPSGEGGRGPIEDVALWEFSDRREEVMGWARAIDRWVRLESRCRHDQVAVLLRDVEPYRDLVREIFPTYGLPFFLDERRNVLAHPRVRFVLRALEILTQGWQRDAVVGFLRNPLLGLSRDAVDRMENLSRARGLDFEAWHQSMAWEVTPEDRDLEDARQRVLGPLRELEVRWRQESFAGAPAVEAIREFMRRVIVAVDESPEGAPGAPSSIEVEWSVRVDARIDRLLDDLAHIWFETPVAADALARVFREGVLSLRLGVTPARLRQVLVGDVQRSRVEGLRCVIVGGCNERVFPRTVRDDPVLNEMDREALARLDVALGPTAEEQQEEEAYLFYIAATRASQRVAFSYARSAEDGRELSPSHLIDEIQRVLPGIGVQVPEVESSRLRLIDVQAIAELGGWLAHEGPLPEVVDESDELLMPVIREALELRERVTRRPLLYLPEDLTRRLYPDRDLVSSVSRLQDFASCAYRHFSGSVLRLVPRPEARVSPLETGVLAHAALEAFFESPTPPDPAAIGRRLEVIFGELERREEFQAFRIDESTRYRWRSVRLALGRFLQLETKRLAGTRFRVLGREVAFGPEWNNAVTIDLDAASGTRLLLRGRIDRLDGYQAEGETRALVVDYKRSARAGLPRTIERGLDLQLAAYLLFVETLPGYRPAGGLYAPVVTPPPPAETSAERTEFQVRYHGLVLEDDRSEVDGHAGVLPSPRSPQILENEAALSSLLRVAEFYLGTFARGLRKGRVAARPLEAEAGRLPCQHCEYPSVCRFRQGRESVRHGALQDLTDPETSGDVIPGEGGP